eukprot:6696668-Prymnesium_polylepis.1
MARTCMYESADAGGGSTGRTGSQPLPLLEHDAIFGRQGARRLNIRRIDCCPLFCSNLLERDRRDTLCGSARARPAAGGGRRTESHTESAPA